MKNCCIIKNCNDIKYPFKISKIINIYYGLYLPNGGNVTEEQFNLHFEKIILPVFPYTTTYDSKGTYLNKNGLLLKENTKVVQIIVDETLSISELKDKINKVIYQYYIEFKQEFIPFVTIEKYGNANFDATV